MLKCKVNTRDFQETIKKLEKIIDYKTKVDIIRGIKLSVDDDGVKLIATDMDNEVVGIITDFDNQNVEPGDTVILNIKKFIKLFKHMKEPYTTIKTHDNLIVVQNGDRKIEVIAGDVKDFPDRMISKKVNYLYEYNSQSLYNRIKKIDFSLSKAKEEPRELLKGIHFCGIDMVTSDGYRISLDKDSDLNVKESFTINRNLVDFLVKTLNSKTPELLQIVTSNKYVVMNYENIKIISKLLNGGYLDYEQIISGQSRYDNSINLKVDELKNDIDFLGTYSKRDKILIKAKITEHDLTLVNITEEEKIIVEKEIYAQEPVDIVFNGVYLKDVLNVLDNDVVELNINKEFDPIIIRENDNVFLILPIRLGS